MGKEMCAKMRATASSSTYSGPDKHTRQYFIGTLYEFGMKSSHVTLKCTMNDFRHLLLQPKRP